MPNHLNVAHLINTNLGRRKYSGFVALVLFWNQVGPNTDVPVKFSEGHNMSAYVGYHSGSHCCSQGPPLVL